jgi:hypothetical protein
LHAQRRPTGDKHLNVHGRYTFTTSGMPTSGLRPLRDPTQFDDEDGAG